MIKELEKQQQFWDTEITNFDAIYSQRKNVIGRLLDRYFRWDMYERFNYTMERCRPVEGRTFLDVGCGTGRYSLELARLGAQKVVGLDISAAMIGMCEQRSREAEGGDRTVFVQSDLLNYSPEAVFDIAIGIGLFDYLEDAMPVLAKMRQWTGDRALLSFPRLGTWRAPVRKIRLGLKGCSVFFYTEKDITTLLKKAGFVRHSLKKIGALYCVTAHCR